MTSSQTFGRIHEPSTEQCEYLTLAFSPLNVPLRSRWRNNGLSADFLGDYVTTFLPREDGSAVDTGKYKEIKHAVTYIANELLENAMKYHRHSESVPIGIHMELTSDSITVSANNGISDDQAEHYKGFIENLLEEDAGELLFKQLEENATKDESESSGLGLLTMIADYGVELGWQFEADPGQPENLTVTTCAVLTLKKVLEVNA